MNTQWYHFLQQQGAHFDSNSQIIQSFSGSVDLPSIQLNKSNLMIPLTHWGVLQVKGSDAKKFLQGQITCNVEEVTLNQARLGAHCNLKGRAYTTFYLCQTDYEEYCLLMDRKLVLTTLAEWQKFIVFSQAEMQDISDQRILLGVTGNDSIKCLTQTFTSYPKQALAQLTHANTNTLLLRLHDQQPRFIIIADEQQSQVYWQQWQPKLLAATANEWARHDIQTGLVHVDEITTEQFIPNDLNYTKFHGISFTKGCYKGQEIIARLHYRGHSKQCLQQGYLQHTNLPPTNAALLSKTDRQNVVGHIISAARAGSERIEFLATVRKDVLNNQIKTYVSYGPDEKNSTVFWC